MKIVPKQEEQQSSFADFPLLPKDCKIMLLLSYAAADNIELYFAVAQLAPTRWGPLGLQQQQLRKNLLLGIVA